MKKEKIQVHLQHDQDANCWWVSLPAPNKPTGFSNAYTTWVEGRQAQILKDAIDGDGILSAKCKYQNHKTKNLIGLEVF